MQESEFTGCVNKVQGRHPPAPPAEKNMEIMGFSRLLEKISRWLR
jgi:hypothetical protein